MKKLGGAIFLALAFFLLTAASVSAQQGGSTGRDPQFEQQIYDRLAKINPAAVQVFKDATAAFDGDDLAAARTGFLKVLEMAPGFADALRRLSGVETYQKDYTNAEMHARQALAADPSPLNQSGVAAVLVFGSTDPAKLKEALSLAQAAQQAQPDDLYANTVLLSAAAQNKDVPSLRLAANRLVELAPEYPFGHFYAGLVAADDGDPERAESELLLAEQYGISKEDIDKILNDGIRTQAAINRGLRWGGISLAGWLVGLGLLFLVGLILSSLTLKAVNRTLVSARYEITPGEMSIRRLYRIVIGIAAGYFYISIPLLILLVIGSVGGIIYMFSVAGSVPVRLAIYILAAGVITLIAIIRSVFARVKKGDPGRKVEPNEMPDLWQLSRQVALKVGTRPVDAIFLTPAVEVAVTERGSLVSKLTDKSERILILGLGSLSGLTQGQLRAILAHEYGHFTNRDTAGGTLARQVQFSVYTMAYTLAANGIARWYNPVWWFINGYHRILLRITLGASRLQEILADRIATLSYGAQAMTAGLKAIIRSGFEFDFKVNAEVAAAQQSGRGLHNLYALPDLADRAPLEQKLAEAMSRPSSPYDSHPAPAQRLALIERIQAGGYFDDDPRPAWDLIPNASRLQEEVTAQIEVQIET